MKNLTLMALAFSILTSFTSDQRPTVLLVSGLPYAGKTSICKAVATLDDWNLANESENIVKQIRSNAEKYKNTIVDNWKPEQKELDALRMQYNVELAFTYASLPTLLERAGSKDDAAVGQIFKDFQKQVRATGKMGSHLLGYLTLSSVNRAKNMISTSSQGLPAQVVERFGLSESNPSVPITPIYTYDHVFNTCNNTALTYAVQLHVMFANP